MIAGHTAQSVRIGGPRLVETNRGRFYYEKRYLFGIFILHEMHDFSLMLQVFAEPRKKEIKYEYYE